MGFPNDCFVSFVGKSGISHAWQVSLDSCCQGLHYYLHPMQPLPTSTLIFIYYHIGTKSFLVIKSNFRCPWLNPGSASLHPSSVSTTPFTRSLSQKRSPILDQLMYLFLAWNQFCLHCLMPAGAAISLSSPVEHPDPSHVPENLTAGLYHIYHI